MESGRGERLNKSDINWEELPGYIQDMLLRLYQSQIELSDWTLRQVGLTSGGIIYLIENGLAEKSPQKAHALAEPGVNLPDYLKISDKGKRIVESLQT
jgi:hypothetical protein